MFAHELGGAHKLVPQHADASVVHHAAQVVGDLEGVLDADEVALVAHAPRPLFRRFRHTPSDPDAGNLVGVVMAPGPVVKERVQQVRQAVLVLAAKLLHPVHLVVVCAVQAVDVVGVGMRRHALQAGQDGRVAGL
eukprot:CAMPEP_0198219242 /NCGR_PEP_ID=MMETSP1445-20131203/73212_1 /TAXON_ID=36898 /ORGANISM="Pyramimonas sp., Strain CCMP2087" /LENGTH=134 /DNA_ID=CAMNT_0043896575 /DNA_START=602 /DNA_END=1003 /DNA_ORIENTATION=+